MLSNTKKLFFVSAFVFAFLWALPVEAVSWINEIYTMPTKVPGASVLRSVDMLDHKSGFMVGAYGTILKTTNGGATWTMVGDLPTELDVYDVDVIDQNTAWAVGYEGSVGFILKTTNGGATWEPQYVGGESVAGLNSVFFFDASTGFAVGHGGLIVQTTDGGATWTKKTSGTTQNLNGVSGGVITSSVVTKVIWAVGGGGVILVNSQLMPSSSWNNWAAQTSPTTMLLRDVKVIAPSTSHLSIMAVGVVGTILRTTNSGNTWTSISAPVSKNWLSVSMVGTQGFIMSNTGDIIKTVDSGASWSSVSSPPTYQLPYYVSAQNSSSYLTAVAVSSQGNLIRYEEIPPSQPSSLQKTTAIGDNTPSFQWSAASDNPGDGFVGSGVSGYYLYKDGELAAPIDAVTSHTFVFPAHSDGTHTFGISAHDKAGNASAINTLSYTIDTTTPVVGAVTPTTAVVGTLQNFFSSYSDAVGVTACELYINDVFQSSMSLEGATSGLTGVSLSFPSAGNYNLKVKCSDGSYTGSGASTVVVVSAVDTAPPAGSISINNGAATTNSTSITLNLSCADNTSCALMQVAVDGTADMESWGIYLANPSATLSSGDGTKTVAVKFKDGSGNVSAQYTDTIVLSAAVADTTAPAVGAVSPITAVAGAAQNFSATYSDTVGVVSCDLYVDSADQGLMSLSGTKAGTASRMFTFINTVSHTLQARCSDAAGNMGLGALTAVSVSAAPVAAADTTAPSTPTGAQKISNDADATPTFIWNTANDNVGATNYLIQVDNGFLIDIGGSTTYTVPGNLLNGSHAFKILAKDAAGNTSSVATYNFTVNTGAAAIFCPLTMEKAYKSSASKAVYFITTDCTKRPFKNGPSFFTYFDSWSEVITTTKTILDSIANDLLGFTPAGPKYDPKYGALVKIVTDPKVYLLLGTEKYWIISESVFTGLKYDWKWIEDVDPGLLNKYSIGSEITYTDHHPNYTIIKYAGLANTYRLEPDPDDYSKQVKRWIKNEKVFNALKFRWDRIVTVPNSEVYKDGKVMDESEVNL